MIMNSNTVIDPRAVMVKSIDTAIADSAMFGSWSSEDFAVWTHLAGLYFGENINEFEFHFNVAGVTDTSSEK
jgi:hypothetical protein